jgi:hypothetical protein
VALCVACVASTVAFAGEPTKLEPFQPGAAGAALVDAAQFDSLQKAFDALPEGGGKVVIPPGRHEITEPLVVRKGDVMIEGGGTSTNIVNRNEEGKPALVVEPPEGVERLWRVQVCDLRITGNPKSGAGLILKNVDEVLVSRVAVEHNGGDGAILDYCYEDPRVSDSLFNYNKGTGLNVLRCHDIIVSANQFEENMDAVHCIDGYNLTMTGNNVDDHLGNGVVVENTYGSIIASNMIEECNGHGVVLRGACYGDAISANTIADCQTNGVRLEGVRDITISANTFVLEAQEAIVATGGACQLTITGNTFNRYSFDTTKRHKLMPAQGILLEGAHDVTVSGNTFTYMLKEAIRATGDANKRLNITGNTILNASAENPGKYDAVYLANLSDSIIAHNIIADDQGKRTMRKAMVFEGTCTSNLVESNMIRGEGKPRVPGKGNVVRGNVVR